MHVNICNSLMLVAAEELVFSESTASSPELRTKGVKNHLVKFAGGGPLPWRASEKHSSAETGNHHPSITSGERVEGISL